jgi:hypothetical protein
LPGKLLREESSADALVATASTADCEESSTAAASTTAFQGSHELQVYRRNRHRQLV